MNESESSLGDLMEEYKLCQQKASNLSDNIWKTALALGVGSVAGIVTLSGKDALPSDDRPWLAVIVSLFAIGILLTWKRLAKRWWSIEQVMFRRMEHIERQSQIRANLYVGHLNGRVEFATDREKETHDKPFLAPDFLMDLDKIGNYETRGIQPMMWFTIEINIATWIAFALLALAPVVQKTTALNGANLIRLLVAAIFVLWFLVRLRVRWHEQ